MTKQRAEVLLVDDDRELNWQLGRGLLRAGYSVTTCLDGEEAIGVLSTRRADVVVTDIAMPRGSGLAVTDWVRQNRLEIPVVVMTALGSPMMKELCLVKGAAHYLEKPVDISRLVDILADLTRGTAFRATLNDFDLLDYLQLAIISGKQVLIEVVSSEGQTGLIFLDRGSVLHADCGALTGEEAFYRCTSFSRGRFMNLPWRKPGIVTVDKPGEYLLLQAARRRDEAGATLLTDTDWAD
jgi:CheY-like chemotaxis protein